MNLSQLFAPNQTPKKQPKQESRLARDARYMAERICSGFQLHDRGQRTEAHEAFAAVDRRQFPHLTGDEAEAAAAAYVDALWAKDAIEKRHLVNGQINPDTIGKADWSPVHEAFLRRANIVGMDPVYADATTDAWRKHKTGEAYVDDFVAAQTAELKAAMGGAYPEKPKEGLGGPGPIPMRYVLAVEYHDMHTSPDWEEAIRVMTPYYEAILNAHNGERT